MTRLNHTVHLQSVYVTMYNVGIGYLVILVEMLARRTLVSVRYPWQRQGSSSHRSMPMLLGNRAENVKPAAVLGKIKLSKMKMIKIKIKSRAQDAEAI